MRTLLTLLYELPSPSDRLDAWKKISTDKSKQRKEKSMGQPCGRGWEGLRGACKRAKRGMSEAERTAISKESRAELAQKIRSAKSAIAKKGVMRQNEPEDEAPNVSDNPTGADKKTVSEQKRISTKNVVSVDSRFTADSLNAAFDAISTPGAAERVAMVKGIVEAQGIQTVFNTSKQIRGKTAKLVAGIESDSGFSNIQHLKKRGESIRQQMAEISRKTNGLDGSETPEQAALFRAFSEAMKINDKNLEKEKEYLLLAGEKSSGFTFLEARHIVVNTDKRGSYNAFDVDPVELEKRAKNVFDSHDADTRNPANRLFSVSTAGVGVAESDFATIIHEIGHQVDWVASKGRGQTLVTPPTSSGLTRYSQINKMEFFAEHFALWVLDGEGLKKKSPVIHAYIEESVKLAQKAERRIP